MRRALLLLLAFEVMPAHAGNAPRFATSPAGSGVSRVVVPGLSHFEELGEVDRAFETEVAFTRGREELRIVVLNLYYPKPGQEEEVLETRLRASAVRARLGLPAGRVLRRTSGSEELPYVIWECVYPDQAAHDRDMDARANSPEFEAVRERMGSLLARFERSVWELRDGDGPLQGASGITVLNGYFAEEGRGEEVLSHRLHASAVRRALGHPGGRVLRRVSEGDLPEVVWQLDYRDLEARERDAEAVSSTPQFREVMDHMGTLLRKFERGVWQVVELPP